MTFADLKGFSGIVDQVSSNAVYLKLKKFFFRPKFFSLKLKEEHISVPFQFSHFQKKSWKLSAHLERTHAPDQSQSRLRKMMRRCWYATQVQSRMSWYIFMNLQNLLAIHYHSVVHQKFRNTFVRAFINCVQKTETNVSG